MSNSWKRHKFKVIKILNRRQHAFQIYQHLTQKIRYKHENITSFILAPKVKRLELMHLIYHRYLVYSMWNYNIVHFLCFTPFPPKLLKVSASFWNTAHVTGYTSLHFLGEVQLRHFLILADSTREKHGKVHTRPAVYFSIMQRNKNRPNTVVENTALLALVLIRRLSSLELGGWLTLFRLLASAGFLRRRTKRRFQ